MQDLAAMFPTIFEEDFQFVMVSAEDAKNYVLRPQEANLLPVRVRLKRKREFTLGRSAAHRALKGLGFENPPPVLQGPGREPLWPEGIVGSITHSGDFAAVVVTRCEFASGVGIDLQDLRQRMRYDISKRVCNEDELGWVNQIPEKKNTRLLLLFSAKESVYKALYPVCKRRIGFHDVNIEWNVDENEFLAVIAIDIGVHVNAGTRLRGKAKHNEFFVLTGSVLHQ